MDGLGLAYLLNVHLPPPATDVLDYGWSDTEGAPHKLQFAILQPDMEWKRTHHHVDAAKNRQAPEMSSNIVIDFGPLSMENDSSSKSMDSTDAQIDKEEKVRRALALVDESEIWSMY